MFHKISNLETVELLELRMEEVERQCISLCRAVIGDEQCNAAASEAKQWFASWPQNEPRTVDARTTFATWFSHGLRFGLCKALRGDMAPLPQATDFSALLYAAIRPVALEVVYRNPEAGLEALHGEYLKRTGLNASRTVGADGETIDAMSLPEGISDEDLAMVATGSVLEGSIFTKLPHDDPSDLHHDLVNVPRRYYSILQRVEELIAELEGTGRLSSGKHHGELMRCRESIRYLSETAFVPEPDKDATTTCVYYACRAALQQATASSTPTRDEHLLQSTAAVFAGRLMELANLTDLRTEATTQTRRERVLAAVSRVDKRSATLDHLGETPPGE